MCRFIFDAFVRSSLPESYSCTRFRLEYVRKCSSLRPIILHEAPQVVISVSAYFNTVQRRATEAAGRMAAFKVLRIVNEPAAGAFAYAIFHEVHEYLRVLVYDFGGGTYDCTTFQRQPRRGRMKLKVAATQGSAVLGGIDIDEEIMSNFLKEPEAHLIEKSIKTDESSNAIEGAKGTENSWQKFVTAIC